MESGNASAKREKVDMVEYERYSIWNCQMTGKRRDYPIRERKIAKSSKDNTTPATTAIGIVRLSTSAISS